MMALMLRVPGEALRCVVCMLVALASAGVLVGESRAATPTDAVDFSVPRGLYDAPFDLTLTASGYLLISTDGSPPTVPYTGPILVSHTMVVRAAAVGLDGTVSDVATHSYVFIDEVLTSAVMDPAIAQHPLSGPLVEASLRELPTVSIVLTELSTVEVVGSIEWIDPVGEDAQIDGGVHIVGGSSWGYPKASIRLNFRGVYGAKKWDLDVYGPNATGVRPTDSLDALTLRSGNHDSMFYLAERGQHLRNFWFDETQLEMGHVMPHGRFAHAYVNGTYHGLFHIRERFGAGFMESYYGGSKADYETMTGSAIEDGTGAAWNDAVALAYDFEEFARRVDVAQYLDYMVLNFYAGNAWDWWSTHNFMASGPARPDVRGKFVFHGNDNDITLHYPWDVDITGLGGPSDVFPVLLAAGHPDFRVALQDAIHRNLEHDGPLTAQNAGARYARLAALADQAIWAESARWGAGWWTHDGAWEVERDNLLNNWFPLRTDEVLRQVRAAGWSPYGAPAFDREPGLVEAGTVLTVSPPEDQPGELWVTIAGRDPRLPGGDPSPTALLVATGDQALSLERSAVVGARMRHGDAWGPIEEGFYEVDEAPPIVLNEWNAVEPDKVLAGGDTVLGRLPGNGGDWLEFVVLQDALDLRGWRINVTDRWGEAGELVFTDHPLLADLAAGTLFTIARDLPEGPAYDPAGGDWRFHLRAGPEGSGIYVSATEFVVTSEDWRLVIRDADGWIRFGPVGESIEPRSGIGPDEVGRLQGMVSAATRRDSGDYGDGSSSTYGEPNTWAGGKQDFDDLRDDPDLPPRGEGGELPMADSGCGCAGGGTPGLAMVLLVGLAPRRRRKRSS